MYHTTKLLAWHGLQSRSHEMESALQQKWINKLTKRVFKASSTRMVDSRITKFKRSLDFQFEYRPCIHEDLFPRTKYKKQARKHVLGEAYLLWIVIKEPTYTIICTLTVTNIASAIIWFCNVIIANNAALLLLPQAICLSISCYLSSIQIFHFLI